MAWRGARMKELRIRRGLTQGQLAEKLHSTSNQIIRFEKNQRKPRIDVAVKIAEAIQGNLLYLTGDSDDPVPFAFDELQFLRAYHRKRKELGRSLTDREIADLVVPGSQENINSLRSG